MRNIPGYEKDYGATESGEIYSYKRSMYMKQHVKKNGYVYIRLSKDGVAKTLRSHRLIAKTFLPKPLHDNLAVNHIDGNKQNNAISNLEWATWKENEQDKRARLIKTGVKKPLRYCGDCGSKNVLIF